MEHLWASSSWDPIATHGCSWATCSSPCRRPIGAVVYAVCRLQSGPSSQHLRPGLASGKPRQNARFRPSLQYTTSDIKRPDRSDKVVWRPSLWGIIDTAAIRNAASSSASAASAAAQRNERRCAEPPRVHRFSTLAFETLNTFNRDASTYRVIGLPNFCC